MKQAAKEKAINSKNCKFNILFFPTKNYLLMELEHNISYEDFKSICRFCLKQDLMLKPIFKCESNDNQQQQGNDGDSIVHMVLEVVGLEVR